MDKFYLTSMDSRHMRKYSPSPINTELQSHDVRSPHAPSIDIIKPNYSKEVKN